MDSNLVSQLDKHIIALSMLSSRSSVQRAQSVVRRSLSETEHRWCCMLDELSWLGDYRTGGKSVTSIAAQATAAGTIFWFASNRTARHSTQRHLGWILQELRVYASTLEKDAQATQWRLFRRSIVFSRRRVDSYHDRLCSLWTHVKSEPDRQIDSPLMAYMDNLVGLGNDHEKLCVLAFDWRNNSFEVQLKQSVQNASTETMWKAIRHYIGRLGSWWNACAILLSTATTDAGLFSNCSIKAVPNGLTVDAILSQQRDPHVSALSAVEELAATHEHQGSDTTGSLFAGRLARRRSGTYVHAELLVLNHFYRRKFVFGGGIPYIGCSKLSCYCCHIYMKLHPGGVLPRACHGNTWVRWAMPILRLDRWGSMSGQDTHILAEMVNQMQREVEMDSASGSIDRQLESTTGISENCTAWRI